MRARMAQKGRGAAVACMAAMVLGGCARHVTLDRETIAQRNGATWAIRQAPSPQALPVQPVSASGPDTAAVEGATASRPIASEASGGGAVPFRNRPDVAAALRSPPDSFGIPVELYKVDPLLTAHRREIESQASARHWAGAGTIALGLVALGASAFALAMAAKYSDSANSGQRDAAAQTAGSGVACGLLGIGTLVGGIVMAAGSSNRAPLQTYYRETYAP